jgi:hypothetical protein
VSILRILSLYDLAHNPQDQSYWSAPPIYWAAIEMNLGMVCACAPSLKPLAGRIVPAFSLRSIRIECGEQCGTRRSRLSSLGRSFQKFSGRDGNSSSRTRNTDSEQGTELGVVTALPPAHRKYDPGHITITHDADQRSDRWPSDGSSRSLVLQGQLG